MGYFYKAIYGAVSAFVASLGTVVVGSETLSQVTLAQWLFAAVAALTAGGAIYGVTNSSKSNAVNSIDPTP